MISIFGANFKFNAICGFSLTRKIASEPTVGGQIPVCGLGTPYMSWCQSCDQNELWPTSAATIVTLTTKTPAQELATPWAPHNTKWAPPLLGGGGAAAPFVRASSVVMVNG